MTRQKHTPTPFIQELDAPTPEQARWYRSLSYEAKRQYRERLVAEARGEA